jgi:uncharacterized membrane protein
MPAPTCWTVKRNCSASPAQLAAVFGSMVAISFVFGVVFATFGLWLILPFVGVELAAVALAFFCYGRRAADFERITLDEHDLRVERVDGSRTSRWRFPRAWARIEVEESGGGWMEHVRVFIAARGERVEVGRHLTMQRRKALAEEIFAALRAAAA